MFVEEILNNIRHMMNDKALMSKDDVVDYLDKLADTIIDYDSVSFDYYHQGNNRINGLIFKKEFSDGVQVSYELVSNKKHALNLQTSYLTKDSYKKRSLPNRCRCTSRGRRPRRAGVKLLLTIYCKKVKMSMIILHKNKVIILCKIKIATAAPRAIKKAPHRM